MCPLTFSSYLIISSYLVLSFNFVLSCYLIFHIMPSSFAKSFDFFPFVVDTVQYHILPPIFILSTSFKNPYATIKSESA